MLTKEQADMVIYHSGKLAHLDFAELHTSLTLNSTNDEIILFYQHKNEIMALANPLTREWALKHVVEKPKKYVLRTIEPDGDYDHQYLAKNPSNGELWFVYVRGRALTGTKKELKKYKSDALEWVEVD